MDLWKKYSNRTKIEAMDHSQEDHGEELVVESLRTRRMNVCKKCEFFLEEYYSCDLCGCFMPIKTFFKFFECPTSKWPQE